MPFSSAKGDTHAQVGLRERHIWSGCSGADPASAHEGEKVECKDTTINAVKADIQVMDEGEAKTTAKKEMQMAEDMMAKKDMPGCVTHLQNAMEATEK